MEKEGFDSGDGRFVLVYRGAHVGVLVFSQGVWVFSYSPVFKRELLMSPIMEFPDVDKEYRSMYLWPFFRIRVPGLMQPDVKEIIDAEGIDSGDWVALLRRFGRRTIANPFELIAD